LKRITMLLALLLLVAAGCANETGSSAEASEAAPTEEPTPEPTPTEEPSEDPGTIPSLAPGAGDLADLLPEEVGGLTLEYAHSSGAQVFDSTGTTPEAIEFLDRVGATPDNVSSAFGFSFDPEAQSGVSIVAFRVEGADEGLLRDGFLSVFEEEGTTIGEETTLGGKTVRQIGDAEATTGYLYVHDDVVYLVSGEPVELAEEALQLLP
jgi:hypothetical protein